MRQSNIKISHYRQNRYRQEIKLIKKLCLRLCHYMFQSAMSIQNKVLHVVFDIFKIIIWNALYYFVSFDGLAERNAESINNNERIKVLCN